MDLDQIQKEIALQQLKLLEFESRLAQLEPNTLSREATREILEELHTPKPTPESIAMGKRVLALAKALKRKKDGQKTD